MLMRLNFFTRWFTHFSRLVLVAAVVALAFVASDSAMGKKGGKGGGGPEFWPVAYRMVLLADSQVAPGTRFADFDLGNGSNMNNHGTIVGYMRVNPKDANGDPLRNENGSLAWFQTAFVNWKGPEGQRIMGDLSDFLTE